MAGAAAVATAVSVAIEGGSFGEMLALAREAAVRAAARGHHFNGSDVSARIGWAVELVRGLGEEEAMDVAYELIGTGVQTQETVATAFALAARWPEDPWTACLQAARLGGDADTIAAITGALVGSRTGLAGFPADAIHLVQEVNSLDFAALARPLLQLRAASR
jgi:ADP-ribosylglycohydrolase